MPLPIRQPRTDHSGPHHPDERAAAAAVALQWLHMAYRTEAVRRLGGRLRAGPNGRRAPAPSVQSLLPAAYDVIRMCRDIGRDPEAHVAACFAVLGHLRPPTLTQVARGAFSNRPGWPAALANAATQVRLSRTRIARRDPTALVQAAERLKDRYAREGARDICRAMIDVTLGFHPGSSHCRSCPFAVNCRGDAVLVFGEAAVAGRGA